MFSIPKSYKLLESQYGNFTVPALKIKINGADQVKALNLVVTELTVSLSTKSAGCTIIKIAGLYDEKKSKFNSSVINKFKPGTVVTVELGYLSSTDMVFKGYVDMLGAEFGEVTSLVVTLMDARRLMMISGKKHLLHDVKNYSDAVRAVLGSYSKLISNDIDATSDSLTKPVSQTTNDYDFITREIIGAGRADREFFITGDTAYFRKPKKVTQPALTVRYGRELKSLKVNFSYLDVNVEVIGYNPDTQASVKSNKSAKSFVGVSKLLTQTPTYTAAAPDADSTGKASTYASEVARELEDKACTGVGVSVGLPQIEPGKYLKVEALDSMLNNSYYLTEVTHQVNEEGYTTRFEIGGVR